MVARKNSQLTVDSSPWELEIGNGELVIGNNVLVGWVLSSVRSCGALLLVRLGAGLCCYDERS